MQHVIVSDKVLVYCRPLPVIVCDCWLSSSVLVHFCYDLFIFLIKCVTSYRLLHIFCI